MSVRKLGLVVIAVFAILLLAIAMNSVIVANVAFTDFFPVQNGCKWLYQGMSPYGEAVTADTQTKLAVIAPEYTPTIDEHRFAYPAHACMVLFPIFALPYDYAAPLWMAINLFALLIIPIIFVRGVLHQQLGIWMLLTLMIITLFGWRYSLILVVLAQFTGVILMVALIAIWALLNRRTWILAFALLVLTIRPESAILAFLFFVLVLRDRQFTISFKIMLLLAVTYMITSLFAGLQWPLDFITRVFEYTTYRTHASTWLPVLFGLPSLLVSVALSAVGAALYTKALPKLSREEGIIWGSALLILLVLLFVPQTNSYTLVYALPVIYLLMISGNIVIKSYMLIVSLIAPWAYAALGTLPQGTDQLLLPLLLMGGFVLYGFQTGFASTDQPMTDRSLGP